MQTKRSHIDSQEILELRDDTQTQKTYLNREVSMQKHTQDIFKNPNKIYLRQKPSKIQTSVLLNEISQNSNMDLDSAKKSQKRKLSI